MANKKSFTTSTELLLNKTRENRPVPEVKTEDKKSVGRPRIHTGRTTSTSQQGLSDGLTRMTFIISQEKQDKLKYISYFERLSIRQILDEAIEDYLNKYEQQFGKIELN